MASLSELRQKYPQYSDMSDTQFADAFHQKFYSDIPRTDFDKKLGVTAQPQEAMSLPDHAVDVAKSVGIGAAKGAIGLAGLSGDIRSVASSGADIAGQKLGIAPEKISKAKDAVSKVFRMTPLSGFATGSTSADLQKNIEGVTGKFYEPKSTAGKYGETVGEMLPAAAAGPGGIARRVLGQAVVPGLASEAAGQATKGTEAEPYARAAASVMAGFPFGRWRQQRAQPGQAPLATELFDAGSAQYKAIREMDLQLKPQQIGLLGDSIANELTQKGLTKANVPETYAVIEGLQKLKKSPAGAFVSASDFDTARQQLLQATRNFQNLREGKAAWDAIGELDSYLSKIPSGHVIRGDADAASKLFDQARKNWAAAKRVEMLNGKLELGDLNAATSHSGMNVDNATRQAVKQLIRPNKYGKTLAEQHGFNPREIAAMQEVARGSAPINTMRYIGSLLGGGGGWGQAAVTLGSMGAGYETGHPELVGLGLVGSGLYRGAGALTERRAKQLLDEVARRSPHGATLPPRQSTSEIPALGGAAALRGISGLSSYGGIQ